MYNIFRLFYQYSTSLFLACSVMVTSNQFFGNPIQCDLVTPIGNPITVIALKGRLYTWRMLFKNCTKN